MKATITIEIQGTKREIDSLTRTVQGFVKKQPRGMNIRDGLHQGWKPTKYPMRPW